MTHRLTRPVLAVLIAAVTATASAVDREPFDLLLVSSYHGDEITAGDGDVYLAVMRDDDGWKTVAAAIRVAKVEDPILDAPGEMTGKEVRVEQAEPIFLVRGSGLAPGPVETLESQGRSLFRSPSFEWTLANGERYLLSVHCPGPAEVSEEARARGELPDAWRELCALRLSYGARSQELAELPVNRLHDSGARLLWAGDLDRDGRLDLLLDLSDHYNMSQPTLFLSSAASDRDIVAPVARLVMTGC